MARPPKKTSVSSALVPIVASCCGGMVLMIVAGVVTGEPLYYLASGFFVLAGILGIVMVRKLAAKINGRPS